MPLNSHCYFYFPFQYLYLLFSDDHIISLDEWVLNTEAHPLPIKGINPLYRPAAAQSDQNVYKDNDEIP